MTLLLIGDSDIFICKNNLGCDNKKNGYHRRLRDVEEERVILEL